MDSWPFLPRSFAKLNVDDNKKWKTIFICEKTEREIGTSHLQSILSFTRSLSDTRLHVRAVEEQATVVEVLDVEMVVVVLRIVNGP